MKQNTYKPLLLCLLFFGFQFYSLQASNQNFDEPFDDTKESRSLIYWSTNDGYGDEEEYVQEFKAIRNRAREKCFRQLARRYNIMMSIQLFKHAAIKYDEHVTQEKIKEITISSPIKLAQDEPEFYFADKLETASQEYQLESATWCNGSDNFCTIS